MIVFRLLVSLVISDFDRLTDFSHRLSWADFVFVLFFRYGKKHPHFHVGSLESAIEEVKNSIHVEDPDQVSLGQWTLYMHFHFML